jgi:hypothetical protein
LIYSTPLLFSPKIILFIVIHKSITSSHALNVSNSDLPRPPTTNKLLTLFSENLTMIYLHHLIFIIKINHLNYSIITIIVAATTIESIATSY